MKGSERISFWLMLKSAAEKMTKSLLDQVFSFYFPPPSPPLSSPAHVPAQTPLALVTRLLIEVSESTRHICTCGTWDSVGLSSTGEAALDSCPTFASGSSNVSKLSQRVAMMDSYLRHRIYLHINTCYLAPLLNEGHGHTNVIESRHRIGFIVGAMRMGVVRVGAPFQLSFIQPQTCLSQLGSAHVYSTPSKSLLQKKNL